MDKVLGTSPGERWAEVRGRPCDWQWVRELGFWTEWFVGQMISSERLEVRPSPKLSGDLLRVMGVAVTMFINVKVCWCPLSCLKCFPWQSYCSVSSWHTLVRWWGICTMSTNKDLKTIKKPQARIHIPTSILDHIIFHLPGSHWPLRSRLAQCSNGSTTGCIQVQPIPKPFRIWQDKKQV